MIYAPIKYKKVNVSSPLYLQCLSYSVAPASEKNRNTVHDTAETINSKTLKWKEKLSNVNLISKIKTLKLSNIGKNKEMSATEQETQNVNPVYKQSAREKANEIKTTFSQKFDALFGEKLNATKDKMWTTVDKSADKVKTEASKVKTHVDSGVEKIKTHVDSGVEKFKAQVEKIKSNKVEKENSQSENSRTKKFKAKIDDLFNRDKENQNEQNETAYAKFKAKVKNMLNVGEKTNKTFAKNKEQEFENVDETLKQMALGVLPTRYDNVKADKTLASIAQNIQEENAKVEIEDVDETFVAMSKAVKKEHALEEKEAIRLANEREIDVHVDEQLNNDTGDEIVVDTTPAISVDDINGVGMTTDSAVEKTTEIDENNSTEIQPKIKEVLAQKLGQTTNKIKEFFALKGKKETVETQNDVENVANVENAIENDESASFDVSTPMRSRNIQTVTQDDENVDEIDYINGETTRTTRKVACSTENNGTYKRKSYYALKVENAKKHIVNAGTRVKYAAKRFVCFFKDKFCAPEVVDFEDKDDYRKFGMKETRVSAYPTVATANAPKAETPTEPKEKTYITAKLDDYIDL